MKFRIIESVKEIRNTAAFFKAAGDCGRNGFELLNVEASGEAVKITGRSGSSVTFRADVSEPGAAAIGAGVLLDALKAVETMPEIVFMQDDNHTVTINEQDGFSSDVSTWEEAFTPDTMPEHTGRAVLSFSPDLVADSIRNVEHCICEDESKWAMCGINIDWQGNNPEGLEDGHIYAIATDGRRLAWSDMGAIPAEIGEIPGSNFTVRKPVVSFIRANCTKTDRITFSVFSRTEKRAYGEDVKRFYAVDFGHWHIADCTTMTDFPAWRRVIPAKSKLTGEFTLESGFLKESERISKNTDKYRKVVFTVSFDGAVSMKAENARQVIKSVEKVSVTGDFVFAMNIDYIREAVKAAGKKALRVMFGEPGRPFMLQPDECSGAVIMPMNLN